MLEAVHATVRGRPRTPQRIQLVSKHRKLAPQTTPNPRLVRSRGDAAQVPCTRLPLTDGLRSLGGTVGSQGRQRHYRAPSPQCARSPPLWAPWFFLFFFFLFFSPGGPGGCVLAVGWEVKPQRAAAAGL